MTTRQQEIILPTHEELANVERTLRRREALEREVELQQALAVLKERVTDPIISWEVACARAGLEYSVFLGLMESPELAELLAQQKTQMAELVGSYLTTMVPAVLDNLTKIATGERRGSQAQVAAATKILDLFGDSHKDVPQATVGTFVPQTVMVQIQNILPQPETVEVLDCTPSPQPKQE